MSLGKKIGLAFAGLIVASIVFSLIVRVVDPKTAERWDREQQEQATAKKADQDARKAERAKVSRESFNRIGLGMTYKEVCDILGPGIIDSESRNGFGDAVMRARWSGGVLTTIRMTFTNGLVSTKTM